MKISSSSPGHKFTSAALVFFCAIALLIFSSKTAHTQQWSVSWNLPQLEAAHVTDYFDITSKRVRANAPGLELIIVSPTPSVEKQVYVKIRVDASIPAIPNPNLGLPFIAEEETNPFGVRGTRVLTANDWSLQGSGAITIRIGTNNDPWITAITNYFTNSGQTTFPPGSATVSATIYDNQTKQPVPGGSASGTVTISFSSINEVPIDITSPRPGEETGFNPVITVATTATQVRIIVVKKNSTDRSFQDALARGNPNADITLPRGVQTVTLTPQFLTIPLENNRSYYVGAEAFITSNRGIERKQALPVNFRVSISNPYNTPLQSFASLVGGEASGTLNTQFQQGFTVTGQVTVEYRPVGGRRTLTAQDLQALLNQIGQLVSQGAAQVTVRVEAQ